MATKRCIATTRGGTRCKLGATPGSQYCFVHKEMGQPPAKMRKGSALDVWRYSASRSPQSSSSESSTPWMEVYSLDSPRPTTRRPDGPVLHNFSDLISREGRDVAPGTLISLDRVYTVIRRLGAGSYGVVFAVESGGNRYALKIETSLVTEQKLCAEADMQRRVMEILPKTPMIYRCDKFYYVDIMHMYTVMELMQDSCEHLLAEMYERILRPRGGGLGVEAERRDAVTAIAHVFYVFREMMSQVATLEARGIYHVDVKPGNMLYSYEKDLAGRDILRVCLSDYGFACDMSDRYECYPRTTISPPEWKTIPHTGAIKDHDAMRRAQWYMTGAQYWEAVTFISRRPAIGGMLFYDFVALISPSNRFFEFLTHLGEMTHENVRDRKNRYAMVIDDSDKMIRHCAQYAHEVNILVNSLMPYTRKT